MKKIVFSLFVAMAACAVMAQDAQKPMILPGAGHINVESLNKKIDLKMDISKLSLSELRVLRNAFAARQGYLFTSSDLRAVFNSTSWYEDLCWKREDENSKMPPIKYSAAETAFINKIKAREDELRKGNLKPASGLVNMDNLINPYQLEEFPTQLRTALGRNGFAIVDNDDEQIFQVYERNDYTMFPNFVTTDLFLQLFHLYFDTMMRKVEEGKLSVVMTDFCQQMYDRMKVRAGYSSNSAAIKDAAEWNQTFFAVGHALITGTSLAPVPEKYKSMAEEELRNSIEAENAYSTYLGYTQVKFPYALFRPRGHYTRSEKSSRYFRAMMWLQSVPFGTDSEDAMYRAALMAETIGGEQYLKKTYNNVFDPITFLMGAPDNITILQVNEIMRQQGVSADDLAKNKKSLESFVKKIDEIAESQTRIRPKFERTSHNKVNLMPQRYQPDGQVLLEMVDTENKPTQRDVSMGLDVMAAMGSSAAERILLDELQQGKQWSDFTPTLAKMKELMKEIDWNACVSNRWLQSLNALNLFKDSRMPYFMKTSQWDKKNLNATLASWAELKHDAILYAKQPMVAECGDGSLPPPIVKGYVEPNVAFWEKAVALLDATLSTLSRFHLTTEEITDQNTALREEAEFLLTLSKKELSGEKITEEEYNRLRYIGATYENLSLELIKEPDQTLMGWNDVQGTDKHIAVVADVLTSNGDNNPQPSVLYEAVGPVNHIYVVVEVDGLLYLMRGGVFSYREFKQDVNAPRMNDEEWQQNLKQAPDTGKPSWMKEIIVPLKQKPKDNELIFYSSGC